MSDKVARIPLTHGQYAVIDAIDLPRVIDGKGKWQAYWNKHTRSYRAMRTVRVSGGRRRTQYMARVIMDAPEGLVVDHINHDTLDNRHQNLRLATNAENQHNRRSHTPGRYAGVSWDRTHQKWKAQIGIDGRHRNLGYFDNPVEAAIMRDVFACLYYGEFAYINLPQARDSLPEAA